MSMQHNKWNQQSAFDDVSINVCMLALPYDHPENIKKMAAVSSDSSIMLSAPQHYAGEGLIETACRDIYLSNAFDTNWYTEKYSDMQNSELDPLWHYVVHGASEGRDPSPWFFTTYYLNNNPDVKEANLNPLHHYVLHGWSEGRKPNNLHLEEEYAAYISALWDASGNINEILATHERAILNAYTSEVAYNRYAGMGKFCAASHHWQHAEEALKNAILTRPDSANCYDLLAHCLSRQGKWWQAIDTLEKATLLEDHHAEWWYRLGEACEAMDRWSAAADAYQKAINLDGQWAEWHYRLGFSFERNALSRPAEDAYANAVTLDGTLSSNLFGIGVFHEKRGYWNDALKAYEKHLRANPPGTAELHAKLAVTYHRCYDMENAAIANFNALTVTPESKKKLRVDAYYRMGITNERMGKLELAEQAYACSLDISPNKYRRYRHGYVLAKMGRYEDACSAYLKLSAFEPPATLVQDEECEAIPGSSGPEQLSLLMAREAIAQYTQELALDTTKTELYFLKGAAQEIIGDMVGAVESYTAGMARQNDHWPEGWYRLGKALHACGRFVDACDAFANFEILRKPYWVDRTHYNKSKYFKIRADYLEYCETLPVSNNIILYESFTGHRVGDSPYALFQEFLQKKPNTIHVWAIRHENSVDQCIKKYKNVLFVRHNSNAYTRYLATANIIITDSVLQPYFIRRKQQLYLNTWHGTPMKSLGKDIANEKFLYGDMQRNFLQSTHMIHQNAFTKDKIDESYVVKDIMTGISCVTGYPRNDLTLNSNKPDLKLKLGISANKTIIFYAPTWRGYRGNVDTDLAFVSDVVEVCKKIPNSILIFRAHSMLERMLNYIPNCKIFPECVSTNELLAVSDVLITDYSSICFDFMATGRPILYYIHDLEKYSEARGMYLSPEDLPGLCCRTKTELELTLLSLYKWKIDAKYTAGQKIFCCFDDGLATKRVVELLSANQAKPKKNPKLKLLFYMDFIPNGIGMSFISLCNSLDKRKYDISILINKDISISTGGSDSMISCLNDNCRIFISDRSMNYSLEEWHDRLQYIKNFSSGYAHDGHIKHIYAREFKRLFGDTEFDVLIDYVGYACHQSELFAFTPCKNKIIYLHNDMHEESKNRFNYLKRIFLVYRHYNKLVSVSDSINQINKANLSTAYSIDENKFVTVPNMQRPEYVRQAAQEPVEDGDESLFSPTYRYFITLGRLSPEKNQAMLLDAFASLHLRYTDTRLLILGQGPLKQQLQTQIARLGLSECVFLLGHKQNPYPYLLRSDCFVFPSKYEGQPVVFYEAFALNMPVIATNIPPSCEVLENGRFGLLTDQTAESFMLGMEAFLQGKIPKPNFDFSTYQTNAMQAFEALL